MGSDTVTITEIGDDLAARVDAIFEQWDSRESPGCALAIVRDGQLVFTRGYGMANLEHDIPITPSSIFHVASISKQFTSFCIALLAQEGKLSLDDDIRTHVPEIPDYGHTITIRHLVHHTSGLRDQWDLLAMAGWREDDLITEQDVLEIAGRQQALNFPPGEQWSYSNTAYTLLAVIVKRVSGKSLREFAQTRIFAPLGMTRTHFHDDHSEIVRGRTQAYETREGGGLRVSIPVFDVVGTTSLFTTVEDLFRWEQNFSHKLVGGAVFDTTLTPGTLNDSTDHGYAFGLSLREYKGHKIVEHSGGDAGYRGHFLRVPAQRFAVICLCNLSTMVPWLLCDQIVDLCLADELAGEPSDRAETATLSPPDGLAGLYYDRQSGDFMRLIVEDGQLALGFDTRWTLVAETAERYVLSFLPSIKLTFTSRDAFTMQGFGSRVPQHYERVAQMTPNDAMLAEAAGRYHSDELDATYALRSENGTLTLRRKKLDDVALHPTVADGFANDRYRITLTRGNEGYVDGFTISTGRTRDVRFVRV